MSNIGNSSLLGAVAGGIIGFFIPGGTAITAMYGASIGLAIGSYFSNNAPDAPTPGNPLSDSALMSSSVGDLIPDLLGTTQIVGHLLAYGKERVEEITETTTQSGGGKGGGSSSQTTTQVTGHRYYMTWALGICVGPIDAIYSIIKENEVVWEGTLPRPVSGGQETIVLDSMLGSCTFYFGTSDQAQNSIMGEISDPTLNSPLRNFCWVMFNDCLIGEYTDRCPTMKFVIRKNPQYSSVFSNSIVHTVDYNPIIAIWHILTQMVGLDSSWLDLASFQNSASTSYSERRGLSILFSNENDAFSYLTNINSHIDHVLRYGSDGKFYSKLIRNDYLPASLPEINETILLEDPSYNRSSWIDTINEEKVQYTEISRPDPYYSMHSCGLQDPVDTLLRTVTIPEPSHTLFDAVRAPAYCLDWSCGYQNVMLIDLSGALWAEGQNSNSQFGFDSGGARVALTKIINSGCAKIATRWNHSILIKDDGTAWSAGSNQYGQTAQGTFIGNTSTFTQIGTATNWVDVSLGYYFTYLLNSNGELWVCGYNGSGGTLGLGDQINRNTLQHSASNVSKITAGENHGLHISEGFLYGTGLNAQYRALALDTVIDTYSTWTRRIVPPLLFTACACWHYYSAVIDSSGFLWTVGLNDEGQLGHGDLSDRTVLTKVGTDTYTDIVMYNKCLYAKTTAGLWKACGYNLGGRLGVGDYAQKKSLTTVLGNWDRIVPGNNATFAGEIS